MKTHRYRLFHLFHILLSVAALTVCVGWLGVRLVTRQQQRIVSTLALRLEQGDSNEAVAAVHQMARMDAAAIEYIVKAAATPRPQVAPAARWMVENLVVKWKREAQTDAGAMKTGQRLERLAVALTAELETFNTAGKVWARAMAVQILHASGAIPAGGRLPLVRNCEAVLRDTAELAEDHIANAAIVQAEGTVDLVSPSPPRKADAALRQPSPDASDGSARPLTENRLERTEPSTFATADTSWKFAETTPSEEHQSVLQPTDTPPRDWRPLPKGDLPLVDESSGSTTESVDVAASTTSPDAAEPIHDPVEKVADGSTRDLPPAENPTVNKPAEVDVGVLDTMQLVVRLVEADHIHRRIDEELARRGYGKLPPPLARLLVSETTSERERAVEALLRAPGVFPTPWLMILADDPAADVRLAVVSLFATSDDPVLIDKAWDVVLHDQDPRIGALTEHLRQKRHHRFRQ